MYFLSSEERQFLLKGLLPKTREMNVVDELRGWNWNRPPLAPVYDLKLPLYEIAGKYCPAGKDVYLKRVMGMSGNLNFLMIQGIVLHDVMVEIMTKAKKLIYTMGVSNYISIFSELSNNTYEIPGKYVKLLDNNLELLQKRVTFLWEFEARNITARIQEVLSHQPYIGEDSLAYHALPVIMEQKLDGSFLGMSHYLSSDAFIFSEPMILDLKFDIKRDFHRLTTTGYAMVIESLYEYPVNIGCLIYPQFNEDGRITLKKDFHFINEELRQWFIEERDEKMRMVFEEIDPGKPEKCYENCQYLEECNEAGK